MDRPYFIFMGTLSRGEKNLAGACPIDMPCDSYKRGLELSASRR